MRADRDRFLAATGARARAHYCVNILAGPDIFYVKFVEIIIFARYLGFVSDLEIRVTCGRPRVYSKAHTCVHLLRSIVGWRSRGDQGIIILVI